MRMLIGSFSRVIARSGLILATAAAAFLFVSQASAQAVPVVRLVKDINPGTDGSDAAAFVTLNGLVYFRANDTSHGFELWWLYAATHGRSAWVLTLHPSQENNVHEF
jgi:hypothetical protein